MAKKENLQETVDNIINIAMSKLKDVIDVNTIVGKPIVVNNTTIVPISKVSVGFVAGGGEVGVNKKQITNDPFAGGSGSGFMITPIGFIVVENDTSKYLSCGDGNGINDIIKLTNKIINNLSGDKNNENDG